MNYNEQFNLLFLKMNGDIASIGASSSNCLWTAEQSYLIVTSYCVQVKPADAFDSQETEIEFFKKIGPGFKAELIYFGEVYFILSTMLERRWDAVLYFENQSSSFQLYYQIYQLWYKYWCIGKRFQIALGIYKIRKI